MNNVNIQDLKLRATFSEEVLNDYIDRMKGSYEAYQSFIYATPSEMFTGLHSLYTKGFTPCNELMPTLIPGYYQVWAYKPESTQQSELYEVVQKARISYQESVDQAKEQLFEALVESEYQEEEAKAQAKAEKEAQKRKETIRSKIMKEYN